jgi:hypothetical protein
MMSYIQKAFQEADREIAIQESAKAIKAQGERIAALEELSAKLLQALRERGAIYGPDFGLCSDCGKPDPGVTTERTLCATHLEMSSRLSLLDKPREVEEKCHWKGCDRESMMNGLCSMHYELDAKFDPFDHCETCFSQQSELRSLEPIIGSGENEMGCPVCHPEWFPCGPEEMPVANEEGDGDGD